jgi:hypothetical protein
METDQHRNIEVAGTSLWNAEATPVQEANNP